MSPLAFFEQLADTPWSMALHESEIAYSILESTHVWSLILFFGLVIVFDLRLLGWAFQKVPVSEFSRRLLPWTVLGFVLMVISGALLAWCEAGRLYSNVFFRIKVLFLLLAGLNVLIFHLTVYRSVSTWDLAPVTPMSARIAGSLSLALWFGLIAAGRAIGYSLDYGV